MKEFIATNCLAIGIALLFLTLITALEAKILRHSADADWGRAIWASRIAWGLLTITVLFASLAWCLKN